MIIMVTMTNIHLLDIVVMVDKKSKYSCSENKELYSEKKYFRFFSSRILSPECVQIWGDCARVLDEDQVDVCQGRDDEEDLDGGVG